MKATGIVRRIDDLGRIVIPKEIRRSLKIREGCPMELFLTEDGKGVTFKKYMASASALSEDQAIYPILKSVSLGARLCAIVDCHAGEVIEGGADLSREFIEEIRDKSESYSNLGMNQGKSKIKGQVRYYWLTLIDGVIYALVFQYVEVPEDVCKTMSNILSTVITYYQR